MPKPRPIVVAHSAFLSCTHKLALDSLVLVARTEALLSVQAWPVARFGLARA